MRLAPRVPSVRWSLPKNAAKDIMQAQNSQRPLQSESAIDRHANAAEEKAAKKQSACETSSAADAVQRQDNEDGGRAVDPAASTVDQQESELESNEQRAACMRKPSMCPVCEDSAATERLACNHAACEECFRMYVDMSIAAGKLDIPCLTSGCGYVMTIEEMNGGSSDAAFGVQLQEALLKACLLRDPSTRFCPEPDCPWAVTVDMAGCEPGDAGCPLLCQMCDKQFCVNCRQSGHEGPCKPSEALQLDAATSMFYKPCPTCRMVVFKDQGCNAVRCRCGVEFCWQCGLPCSEAVHFLPHKPCSLFQTTQTKPTSRLKIYTVMVATSPLLAVPAAAFGAGAGVWIAHEVFSASLNLVQGKAKRRAYKALYIGTAPIWVLGSGVIGASVLVGGGLGYMVVFPALFAKERIATRRRKGRTQAQAAIE